MRKAKTKWMPALLLTLLVHAVFFLIIYTHVNVREHHADALASPSFNDSHAYDSLTTPMTTLSTVTVSPKQTHPSPDSAVFDASDSIALQQSVAPERTIAQSDKSPVPTLQTTSVKQNVGVEKPATPTHNVVKQTPVKNKNINDDFVSLPNTTERDGLKVSAQQPFNEIQGEAGLLAADTPQTPADSSQPTIETAAPHKKAKQEAEAINEELRAVIAAVKARNQQQINQVSNKLIDTASTVADAAQDISTP